MCIQIIDDLRQLLFHEIAMISLKMLGLYLYTLIIGHKSCNIFSILNKLKLYKELQTFVTNNVKTQQQQNKKHKNHCRS